jgi:hypothetical protein
MIVLTRLTFVTYVIERAGMSVSLCVCPQLGSRRPYLGPDKLPRASYRRQARILRACRV